MFTGIVQELVKVISFQNGRLILEFSKELLKGLKLGASVSVNGVCLTVVLIEGRLVSFDVIAETRSLTNLATETRVNCERSLKMGDELGGHLLSGHVEMTLPLKNRVKNVFTFKAPKKIIQNIYPKGFIALDGVSLTVVDVLPKKGEFTVHLIPETLKRTTFGFKKIGDFFNVETDFKNKVMMAPVKKKSNSLVSLLGQFVADSFIVYVKTLNYHWNMVGSEFFMYHKLLEEQYKDLSTGIDDVAERIRQLGGTSPGTMKEFLDLATLQEGNSKKSQVAMIQELTKDHEQLVKIANHLIEVSDESEDQGTSDLLIERMRASDKNAWLLRSHLKK